MIAFLADEDLNGNIIGGLRESQTPVNLVTAKEAELMAHTRTPRFSNGLRRKAAWL